MATMAASGDALDLELAKRGFGLLSEAHYAMLEANLALSGVAPSSADYATRVKYIDAGALALTQAKWHLFRATGDCADFAIPSYANSDVKVAIEACGRVMALAAASVEGNARVAAIPLARRDREILRIGEAPVVPSICPVVVLQGDSRTMGRQYAEQCIDIFGPFVFERAGRRTFSQAEQQEIARWRDELASDAPEIIAFAGGMAEGATLSGLPMSAEQALALWTGWEPPADQPMPMGVRDAATASIMNYFGSTRSDHPATDAEPCSGVCAWGEASEEGGLLLGATTDHDCTFQVTVVAYPDEGYPHIYTPFSVNGSIPGVGYFYFAGLPGINAKGLGYVHHGGGIGGCAEPREYWGYGIRRGASTFHLLRFAKTAKESLQKELSWPIGDAATMMGSAGGFYADPSYGYVLESRGDGKGNGVILRDRTFDREGRSYSFLYANNNVLSPKSGHVYSPPEGGYEYELEAGWFTMDEAKIRTASPAVMGRRMMTKSSVSRNCYLHGKMLESYGRIDLDYIRRLYERGPRFPAEPWRSIETRWLSGERMEGSTSHRGNAFTALAAARPRSVPEYWACVGSAAGRAVTPNRIGHGYFYYDETAAFWRLSLEDSPQEVVAVAEREAAELLDAAEQLAGAVPPGSLVQKWLAQARQEVSDAQNMPALTDVRTLSRRVRGWLRAQVRARQIINALAS